MARFTFDEGGISKWMRNANEELPRAVTDRIRRKAIAEATKFYTERVRAGTPVFDTGEVRQAVTSIVRRYQRRGRRGLQTHVSGRGAYFLGIVGFRLSGPNTGRQVSAPHAHLIEFGTVKRATKGLPGRGRFRGIQGVFRALRINRRPGVYNRGIMPAQPFFRAIVRASLDGGAQRIEDVLRAELTREYERIGRGQDVPRGSDPQFGRGGQQFGRIVEE